MGRTKLDSINEFARHGYKVRVSCSCGRKVDWSPFEMIVMLQKRRLPYDVERLEPKLRCGFCFESLFSFRLPFYLDGRPRRQSLQLLQAPWVHFAFCCLMSVSFVPHGSFTLKF